VDGVSRVASKEVGDNRVNKVASKAAGVSKVDNKANREVGVSKVNKVNKDNKEVGANKASKVDKREVNREVGVNKADNKANKEVGVSKVDNKANKVVGVNKVDSKVNKANKVAGVFHKQILPEILQTLEAKVGEVSKVVNKEAGVSQFNQYSQFNQDSSKVVGANKVHNRVANKVDGVNLPNKEVKVVGASQLSKVDREAGANKVEEDGNDCILLCDLHIF
jgi:hypothetical protein